MQHSAAVHDPPVHVMPPGLASMPFGSAEQSKASSAVPSAFVSAQVVGHAAVLQSCDCVAPCPASHVAQVRQVASLSYDAAVVRERPSLRASATLGSARVVLAPAANAIYSFYARRLVACRVADACSARVQYHIGPKGCGNTRITCGARAEVGLIWILSVALEIEVAAADMPVTSELRIAYG